MAFSEDVVFSNNLKGVLFILKNNSPNWLSFMGSNTEYNEGINKPKWSWGYSSVGTVC